MNYNFSKKSSLSFQQAENKIAEELKKEGFGIITEIDLKEKFKEKLNIDFRQYKILGACNPALAFQAIEVEKNIGTMLPCNIVIQEMEDGEIHISAINPMEAMSSVKNEKLHSIASQVSNKLEKVLENL